MQVYRKKMPNGRMSPTYYVRAVVNGKRICRSTGKSDERGANAWARRHIDKLRGQNSVRGLVENYREILGGSKPIRLDEAFELYATKPRKRSMGEKQKKSKEGYWKDFLAFMAAQYPTVTKLSQVTRPMAETYVAHLGVSGRFVKESSFTQRFNGKAKKVKAKNRAEKLSNRTRNVIQTGIQSVFEALREDAGLLENPFGSIPKQESDSQSREAFTPDELGRIAEAADPCLYPIFLIGVNTGLREGDICTLRWREIDLEGGWITRRMMKTGKTVRIPILPGLRDFLRKNLRRGTHVLPFQARMYRSNPDGISYRVKALLDHLKIRHTRVVPGRSRRQTTKDVHSLRHTFCYVAANAGVPLHIVQSIVGHVDMKITQMYTAHVDDAVAQERLAALPDFLRLKEAADDVDVANPTPEPLTLLDQVASVLRTADANNWQLVIRDTLSLITEKQP